MLKLLLPIMLMPANLNKMSWWSMTSSLMFMATISLLMMKPSMYTMSLLSMMDPMSWSLITLSIMISSLMMMTSTKIMNLSNYKYFMLTNITLLLVLINCFSSTNLFNFYIWFEASLIPTMMIIMLWGYQPERVQASMYMMIYTILASLPMLVMFYMLFKNSMNSSFITFMFMYKFNNMSMTLLLISGFLVKLPMFIVHLWLPKAHVEAPIAGSMVLAAILLKLGGYGIMRMLMMLPNMSNHMTNMMCSISLTGGIITSLMCMRQPDLKSMIAYSSVGHMGLMLSAILSNSKWGMMGSMLMMVAHGLTSSALFSLANMTYELTNTRSIFLMKGMLSLYPTLSMWWFMFSAMNMATPPSINLMSEIMLMTSITSMSMIMMIPLMMMSFITGAYSLHMYASTQHGHINNFSNPNPTIKSKDMLMLMMHITPAITIIMKTEMLTLWS